MEAANLLSEWAWLLMESLASAGVTDVVICPGSRSTPFVLAAAENPRLKCHTLVDERSAAFFALGQGKVTGRPSLLISTSGTAGANYLPAVVEARLSHAPLLVLTADRPLELADCAAPQTIDQVKLFGDHAVHFAELGLPDSTPGALRALRRIASQAVFHTTTPVPGAVHLNARARKPLEPPAALDEAARQLRRRVRGLAHSPPPRAVPPHLVPHEDGISILARACRRTERGLIVCGPAPLSQSSARSRLLALARLTAFPLLAEATSQLRFLPPEETAAEKPGQAVRVDAFDLVLRSPSFRRHHPPEVVLQVGQPPTSRMWETYMDEHPDCRRFVVSPYGWNDPSSAATLLLWADVGRAAEALVQELSDLKRGETPWQEGFRRANDLAWKAVEGELGPGAANGTADPALSEGAVAHLVVESLTPGQLLAVGNSLPVRQVDSYCRGADRDLGVWSQRGANGIDGVISGAAGAASVGRPQSDARPVTLLIGDVSFLHDLSGLLAARAVREVPLVVVVAHNDGGRIFEQLPIVQVPGLGERALEHWLTPHGLCLEPAARLFGLGYHRVETHGALRKALAEAQATSGCTVIEAVVPPHSAREQNRRLWESVDRRLRELGTEPREGP